MNLINVPAISFVAVYYFHFVSFVGVLSVKLLSDIFHLSVEQSVPPRTSEFAFADSKIKRVAILSRMIFQFTFANSQLWGESVVKTVKKIGVNAYLRLSISLEPLLREEKALKPK